MSNVNFTNGLQVVSSARKLIIAVPNGNVIGFPEGVTISPYGQNNSAPVFVVHNHVDVKDDPNGSWQGADSVNGVFIANGVPETVALSALEIFEANPTIDGLHQVISLLEASGCVDNYTTKRSFVETKLSPAGRMLNPYTGLVKRDDRDVCLIVRDANGTIWRKLGDSVQHIDTDEIIVRDYVNVDGKQIDPTTIPVAIEEVEA